MKKFSALILTSIVLLFSCENNNDSNPESLENYIKYNNKFYEISQGIVSTGLYEDGPDSYTAFKIYSENLTDRDPTEDDPYFSGTGNACYLWFQDELYNGNFDIDEGWIVVGDINFNGLDVDNLPSANYKYFTSGQINIISSSNPYQIAFFSSEIEIMFKGNLTLHD